MAILAFPMKLTAQEYFRDERYRTKLLWEIQECLICRIKGTVALSLSDRQLKAGSEPEEHEFQTEMRSAILGGLPC